MGELEVQKNKRQSASKIRSKNTKIELIVRKFLFRNGFRYRIHDKRFTYEADIVLPKFKTVIDVRGCYWHNHQNCKYGDKVDQEADKEHRKSAIERDLFNEHEWKNLGWNVIIVWGRCELEDKKIKSKKREQRLQEIKNELLIKYGHTSN